MLGVTRSIFESDSEAPSDEADEAADAGAEAGAHYQTGILPSQDLARLVQEGRIAALPAIEDNQIQPASIDLRLGPVAYRVRASFLPGKNVSVQERLRELAMHEMDISNGGVLERGCVYIIPLMERLRLRRRMFAAGNPKSSTGRLDIFTRLITDSGTEFDRVPERYEGPLYAEVSPRTFSVLVRKGSRLNQLRIRHGNPSPTDEDMKRLHRDNSLVEDVADEEIKNGVPVMVDVRGDRSDGLIGFKAKSHAGLIDIDRIREYEVLDYWDPVYARNGELVLDPADFYILASSTAVKVPSGYAAEMLAYDTLVGEFRVHYAGFFDPGFGSSEAGGEGARAVLEVRSYEVPFLIEHNQIVGRLIYERLMSTPEKLYGLGVGSNYQRQGLALSKHFKPFR